MSLPSIQILSDLIDIRTSGSDKSSLRVTYINVKRMKPRRHQSPSTGITRIEFFRESLDRTLWLHRIPVTQVRPALTRALRSLCRMAFGRLFLSPSSILATSLTAGNNTGGPKGSTFFESDASKREKTGPRRHSASSAVGSYASYFARRSLLHHSK